MTGSEAAHLSGEADTPAPDPQAQIGRQEKIIGSLRERAAEVRACPWMRVPRRLGDSSVLLPGGPAEQRE